MVARFHDFEIDEAQFELRQAGKLVQLEPKTIRLILLLLRHRNRVVRKLELLDALWPGVKARQT